MPCDKTAGVTLKPYIDQASSTSGTVDLLHPTVFSLYVKLCAGSQRNTTFNLSQDMFLLCPRYLQYLSLSFKFELNTKYLFT